MPASSPIIILDAGPLKAAVDRADPHGLWTTTQFLRRTGPFVVTSAAIAEATHILGNGASALDALSALVARMQVLDPAPGEVLAEMRHWAPRMDFADACAVLLCRRYPEAVVLTTDHRDFSIYRVPFISPKGEFHG